LDGKNPVKTKLTAHYCIKIVHFIKKINNTTIRLSVIYDYGMSFTLKLIMFRSYILLGLRDLWKSKYFSFLKVIALKIGK